MLIEGIASVFLETDTSGDRVRPGAFARSLKRAPAIPMLWRHRQGAQVGRWTHMRETGRGLEVRGLIDGAGVYARLARQGISDGLDGLSIGFHARRWRFRPDGGRDLLDLDLVEISLVATPMAPSARFRVLGEVKATGSPLAQFRERGAGVRGH